MFAKKRTGGAAASGKNKQAKHTGPAAARASKSVDVQDGKSRFMQKAPAVLLSAPLIVVVFMEGRPLGCPWVDIVSVQVHHA